MVATTFSVFSGGSFAPSVGEVLALGRIRLQEQLQARDIWTTWTLRLELREFDTHACVPLDPAAPFMCDSGQYIWLYFAEADGGADITLGTGTPGPWSWADRTMTPTMRAHVNACMGSGFHWLFRRSAGQPGIVAFACGIMAAVLAELTDGFVDSVDNAWDADRLPAKAEDFYTWYFQPAQALAPEFARWSRECLRGMSQASTLTGRPVPDRPGGPMKPD